MAQIRDWGLGLAGSEFLQLLLLISVGAGFDQIAELAVEHGFERKFLPSR